MNQDNAMLKNKNILKKKIDLSVLITSIYQRKNTIETAIYFSEMCNEVILVDEE